VGMRGSRLRAGLAVGGLVIAILWSTPVQAEDARDLYKNAMRAVDAQQWETAIQLLRQAIAIDPEAKSGTFRKYIPHFYLGYSLYQLGNCKSALIVWEESYKQGVIQQLKEFGDFQQGVTVCRKRIARQDLNKDLAEVMGFATALGELRSQPELASAWKEGEPSWDDRLAASEQQLGAARAVLERSDSALSMQDFDRAREYVVAAAQQLEVIQSEARNRYKEVKAKIDVRSRLIDMVLEEARQALAATAYLAPFPPRLGELRSRVERLVAQAEQVEQTADPEAIDDLRLQLSGSLESLKQASTGPPEALLELARAYLSGDYEGVLALVERNKFPAGRQLAHARLFTAAALYTLWVGGGEQDDGLYQAASEAVRSCREEDIALVPLAKVFSPRFTEFFFSEGRVRTPLPLDQD